MLSKKAETSRYLNSYPRNKVFSVTSSDWYVFFSFFFSRKREKATDHHTHVNSFVLFMIGRSSPLVQIGTPPFSYTSSLPPPRALKNTHNIFIIAKLTASMLLKIFLNLFVAAITISAHVIHRSIPPGGRRVEVLESYNECRTR